jgi:hypothetical protein
LRKIILALGHQGDIVIVGRNAHHILQAEPERPGIEVEKSDRERARLTRRDYGADRNDPLHYSLIINTAEMSLETAAEIVVSSVRQKLNVQVKGTTNPIPTARGY